MADEAKLVVALEAKLNKFEKQLKEAGTIAERSVKGIEDRFSRSNIGFGESFTRNLLGAAAAAFTLERAFSTVINTIKSVGKLGDVAERVGLSAEQFQELRFAIQQTGGDADQASAAMDRFSNNIAKASQGAGYLADVFKANGVALRDANGEMKSSSELLQTVFNLMQNIRSPQERLNLATELFGRQAGPAFAAAAKDGAAGLAKLGSEAQSAGAIIDNELVAAARKLDDQWDKLIDTFTAKGKSAILEGIGVVQTFLNKVEEWAKTVLPILEAINKFNPINLVIPKNLAKDAGLEDIGKPSSFGPTQSSGTKLTVLPQRGGGAAKKDPFERTVDNIEKRIAVLNAETAAIDLGTAARERARVVAELETAAKQANEAAGLKNTEVTAAQRVEIDNLAAAYLRAAQAAEDANSPLRQFAREAANVKRQFEEGAVSALRGFEDALVDIVTGAKDAKEAFRQMANAIIADLARIAIRSAITGPIASALGGALGGPFGGIPLFGKALGGPVAAGMPYMVGESGPELFVPKVPGVIRPNGASVGGGTSVVVQNTNHFQAGIGGNDMAMINAMVNRASQRTVETTVQVLRGSLRNDPGFLQR